MKWKNMFGREKCPPSLPTPELTVAVRHGEDGYFVAECLQLPGCMSQGQTEKEALENIVDAIESCLLVQLSAFLRGSCEYPPNLVGIEAQGTFRVKPLELEAVTA